MRLCKVKCFIRAVIAAITVGATIVTSYAYGEDTITLYEDWDSDLREYVSDQCENSDVEEAVVIAIIYNESRFNADAIGSNSNGTHDWGLMQLNDSTFGFLKENVGIESMQDCLDPYTNIDCGIALLQYHYDYTQNTNDMIFRYQVGEGAYNYRKRGSTYNNVVSNKDSIKEYLDSKENYMPTLTVIQDTIDTDNYIGSVTIA